MMLSRIRCLGGAFGVVNELNCSSFRCRCPGTSASWHFRKLGRAAAAGRSKSNQFCTPVPASSPSRADDRKFQQDQARAQRFDYPNLPVYPAKERIPKPDPEAGQVWTTAPFSSTVHGAFFFGKTKKNGGCIPPSPGRETLTSLPAKGKRTADAAVLFVFFRTPRCPRCGDGAARPGCC